MAEPRTARARARAALTADIKELALGQLAADGAAGLSLRAVARELGMVSSAIYRYFTSRDELLTALIMDAYSDLADQLDRAREDLTSEYTPRERWIAAAVAMRSWALAQPHRFWLIYGTPVPGYAAPADTTGPAERVMLAFFGALDEAARRGEQASVDELPEDAGLLRGQLVAAGALLGEAIPSPVLARGVAALAQLIGMINFELGGHFAGGFEPADDLYEHTVSGQVAALFS